MKKIAAITLFPLYFITNAVAQDTIRVDPSMHYFSNSSEEAHFNTRMGRSYRREDIVFNDRHKKIEYCYYYDNKRICFGETYKLVGDSTLQISDSLNSKTIQQWTYRKITDKRYFVYRCYDGIYESGIATELMPLTKIHDFISLSQETRDTLWIADYDYSDTFNRKFHSPKIPHLRLTNSKIKGKIYDMDKVDQLPTFLNGDSLPHVIRKVPFDGVCYNEPYLILEKMSFIVTSNGEIKNIYQHKGNFDMNDCSSTLRGLMTLINQYGRLKPAKHKGKNVAIQYLIDVDMTNY